MSTNYSARVQAILCASCGAPLPAAVPGGRIRCDHCGTINAIEGRDDSSLSSGDDFAGTPEQYFALLRAQDGQPLAIPASVRRFLRAGRIAPERLRDALELFVATRDEVRRLRSPEAAERLYALALVLASHFAGARDHTRRRAVLETALTVLFLRRHVQVVRCMLAEAAASEGDLEAAKAWLEPCSPRTGELESDSALRVASALYYTVTRDFDAVLRLLGTVDEQVPIHDARDPMAAVLRANALEKKGHERPALAALLDRMRREAASGRRTMEMTAAAHPELMLCRESLPVAIRRFRAGRARGVAWRESPAIYLLLAAIVLLAIGVASGVESVRVGALDPKAVLATLFGLFLLAIGGGMTLAAFQSVRAIRRGVSATGTVIAVDGTGMTVNDVPQVRIRARVEQPGRPPLDVSCVAMANTAVEPYLQVGAEVPLLVDPEAPRFAALDLD